MKMDPPPKKINLNFSFYKETSIYIYLLTKINFEMFLVL
mgnify:CR=1 FL=1